MTAVPEHRLPPPWSAELQPNYYVLCATPTSSRLAYVYFENELGHRSAAKLLTKDERRIAKLLELLPRPKT
jgi:hypothetical protein